MFRARTGVKGSFGSNTHDAKRLKATNNARLPNGQLPPMQAVSGDVEMDALPDLSTKYDTVYIGRHEPTLKDDAVFDYLSPWLRQALSSTKIGVVNADSHQHILAWHKRPNSRLSNLETGLNNQYNHPFPTSYSSYKCVSIDLLIMNSFHSSQAQYAAAFKTSPSSKNWPYHYHNPTKIVLTMSFPALMIYIV